ncbi:MAG TPA: hypothetical protein VF214_00580, partial [Edaphobacter sp.]
MKAIPSFLLAVFVSISARAEALNHPQFLKQLNHRVYTVAEGAPGDIHTLAQTTDGILWIAAGTGLVRFDGARFMPYPGPSEERLPRNTFSTIAAAPDGGLWVGFHVGGASFLTGGHVSNY